MMPPSTSFEPNRASLFPETIRSPSPGGGSAGAQCTPMVLRVENTTLAEALTLIPVLRPSVAVTVEIIEGSDGTPGGRMGEMEQARETFLFHQGCLLGDARTVVRLRALVGEAGAATVVMTTAEDVTSLFGRAPSVMEILLDAGDGERA